MNSGEPSADELVAQLACRGAEIASTHLVLRRPSKLLRALYFRPVAECLRLLPTQFPLGGFAHALAACEAFEAAVGTDAGPAQRAARATIALADAVAAHVWRSTLEWPQLLEQAVDGDCVAQARQLVAGIASSLYPRGDWCAVGGGFLAPDAAQLKSARSRLGVVREAINFERTLAAMRVRLSRALIGADPLWPARLQPCFAEIAAAAINSFAILDARLQAVAALPQGAPAENVDARIAGASGRGSGQVLTARGMLNYQLAVVDGILTEIEVEAPGDRVFAPGGTAAALLSRLHHAENPVAAARWILAAFDPDASVRIEVLQLD